MLSWKKWQRIALAIALLAVPMALLGVYLLVQQEFADTRSLRLSIDQSAQSRSELLALLSQHQDVELGQRGFVLTGNDAFLLPYNNAIQNIPTLFGQPDPAGGPSRQWDELRTLSDAKISFAARTIALVNNGRGDEARQLIATGEGKRLMDALRLEIQRLDQGEELRLSALTDARNQSRNEVERLINLTLAALTIVLAIMAFVIWRTLQQRHAALVKVRALSDRNSAILSRAVEGIMVLDETGVIREINPSVTRLFGYSESELVGKHNTALMANPPPMDISQAWLRNVGMAGIDGSGEQQEFIGRRSDGSTLVTDVSVSRFAENQDAAYIAIVRDVTERKRVEQMKTEFVSTVSHELRTPLTSIGGSLGLLAAGAAGELSDRATRLVSIANTNCERLVRLINDLLDIEKIESGKIIFDLRRMALGPLVERTVSANRGYAQTHDVSIESRIPPWPVAIMGDPDRLEQLVTNLLSNAIKHSPSGGTVEISLETHHGKARIAVEDRGAGIPADFRNRIFGKFAMADSSDSRARGGTGLGLAISREIAERHGGTIAFADRDGGGTRFFVDLPLAACQDETEGEPNPSGLPALLHLDDDDGCLSVVSTAFAGRADIVSVASVDDAHRELAKQRFDGAIVDVIVPPESGLDLLPALRAAAPGMPIVVFTALDHRLAASKVDAVLVKGPSSVPTLVETTMALVTRASRENV